jgi:hypothetical protein
MSNNLKTFLFILLAVFLISGGLIFISAKSKKTADNTNTSDNGTVAGASTQDQSGDSTTADPSYLEQLAKFMTEKGMAMYGAYWCSHCQAQKQLFGDAFQYVDYVECDAQGPNGNPNECTAQGIEGYPTWIYQGKKYEGQKTLAELAQIVGFNQTDTNTDTTAQ